MGPGPQTLGRLSAVRNVLASVVDIGAKMDYDAGHEAYRILPSDTEVFRLQRSVSFGRSRRDVITLIARKQEAKMAGS